MAKTRALRNSSRLIRLMVVNWAFGWAIGFAVAGAVLVSNMAHIRDLMFRSEIMWQALALLFGGFGFTFAGVCAATAVMLLPVKDAETRQGGGPGTPVLLPAYALARVRVRSSR
jgi:hypothetical protein